MLIDSTGTPLRKFKNSGERYEDHGLDGPVSLDLARLRSSYLGSCHAIIQEAINLCEYELIFRHSVMVEIVIYLCRVPSSHLLSLVVVA